MPSAASGAQVQRATSLMSASRLSRRPGAARGLEV